MVVWWLCFARITVLKNCSSEVVCSIYLSRCCVLRCSLLGIVASFHLSLRLKNCINFIERGIDKTTGTHTRSRMRSVPYRTLLLLPCYLVAVVSIRAVRQSNRLCSPSAISRRPQDARVKPHTPWFLRLLRGTSLSRCTLPDHTLCLSLPN